MSSNLKIYYAVYVEVSAETLVTRGGFFSQDLRLLFDSPVSFFIQKRVSTESDAI